MEHYLGPLHARIVNEDDGDPETFYDRLAEASELTREEVTEAFMITSSKDPGHLLKVVRRLQTLLKQ